MSINHNDVIVLFVCVCVERIEPLEMRPNRKWIIQTHSHKHGIEKSIKLEVGTVVMCTYNVYLWHSLTFWRKLFGFRMDSCFFHWKSNFWLVNRICWLCLCFVSFRFVTFLPIYEIWTGNWLNVKNYKHHKTDFICCSKLIKWKFIPSTNIVFSKIPKFLQFSLMVFCSQFFYFQIKRSKVQAQDVASTRTADWMSVGIARP